MNNNKFIIFFCLLLITANLEAQVERLIIETYYIADQFDSTDTNGGKLDAGSVTYRIFVDMKPANKLIGIYGDTNHVLWFKSTKPFFNHTDGQTYAKEFKKGILNEGTVALDTWLTIGQTTSKSADLKANFGVLKRMDQNGSFIGGPANNGGSAAIPGGLLTNSVSALGIPLTTADGMYAIALPSYTWNTFGLQDYISGTDSTIFGSAVKKAEFYSRNAYLRNAPGVAGVNTDSNLVLIAQLTTKGELSFELNLEILVDGISDTVRYVANDDTLVAKRKEKKSSFLKYPFPQAVCGCKDPAFLEYNSNYECSAADSCRKRIVFGCMDTMACNFEPGANFHVKNLCCYPGSCGGRDLSVVCPKVKGSSIEMDLFPNPTDNKIYLNVTTGLGREMNYGVYNYFGTIVLSKELGQRERIINEEISLEGLSNGLYLVRVNVGDAYVFKQFLKN